MIKSNENTTSENQKRSNTRVQRNIIEHKNPPITGFPPEGYLTVDEFFGNIKSRLKKYYQENGLLK